MQRFVHPLLALIAIIILSGGCSDSDPLIPQPDRGDDFSSGISQPVNPGIAASGMGVGLLPGDDVRNLPRWMDDEVVVMLHDGVPPSKVAAYAENLELSLINKVELMFGTVYRMHIDSGEDVESVVEKLLDYPEVRYAEPQYYYYPCAEPYYPNDPLFEYPGDEDKDPYTHMYDQWGPNVLGASMVWPHGKGDPDVVVAVLDTGYRFTHEDLMNQYWINEDEIPDNGIDDDDNGYIDDWRGWDTDEHDNDPSDSWGHGTACSGVVAAEQGNGKGCTGIAPGVKVMAIRCHLWLDAAYTTSVIEGVQYAYDNGAVAVSMSFRSYEESDLMHEVFTSTYQDGTGLLPIGAAGNENTTNDCWPADWPEVFEIGATCSFYNSGEIRDVKRLDSTDFGWGSNYGENLEIMAPGALYVTTHVGGDSSYYDGVNHGTFGGTSNATPCVAACVGLLKSYYPEMNAAQLRQRLKESADDIHTPGHDEQTGWGRVNIWRAIFGSDPNENIYDANGHIPIETDDEWQYDGIFDVSTSADYDFEDIFVLNTEHTGLMTVECHIITTGQNLDMEIYSDPQLNTLIASGTGPNDHTDPIEIAEINVTVDTKYYVRVFSPEPFNCSNFRVRYTIEHHKWWVEWESLAPEYIFTSSAAVPVLKIDVCTNVAVSVNSMQAYINGTIPTAFINNLILYEDINDSGEWEPGQDLIAGSTKVPESGINQLRFEDLTGKGVFDNPLTYFIVGDIGPNTLYYDVTFGVGLHSYKDITILEDAPFENDTFPIVSDLTLLAQDHQPPEWNSTIGIQDVLALYESVVVYWNGATDEMSEPTTYNLYMDTNDPPDIATAVVMENIAYQAWDVYDYFYPITMLENGQKYFFLVRATDSLGNEDDNLIWMEAMPDDTFDPQNPKVVGKIVTGGSAKEVWVHENIAYVANGSAGIAIVDCSQPTLPVLIGTYPGKYCEGIQYHEGQDYVYASYIDGMMIVDPHAPGGPELVSLFETGWDAMDLFIDGDICYVGVWGGDLLVIDASFPEQPELLGEASIGEFQSFKGISARDGYVYCATPTGGLRIVDATDPTDPELAHQLGLGEYASAIQLWGDYALVTCWLNHTLYAIDITDPPNAFIAGQLNFPSGLCTGIAVRDDEWAYVGNSLKKIQVIQWDELDNMTIHGSCDTDGPNGLFFDGIFLYSAENEDGLKIIY